MVSCLRDTHLEEIGIAEHRISGGKSTAGVSVNSGAVNVDPSITLGELLHARDLIGERVVSHFAVVRVVEGFRSPRRAHPIDLHDDEPQFGERLCVTASRRKTPTSDAASLWAGIDMVDDREYRADRIEACRTVHQTV